MRPTKPVIGRATGPLPQPGARPTAPLTAVAGDTSYPFGPAAVAATRHVFKICATRGMLSPEESIHLTPKDHRELVGQLQLDVIAKKMRSSPGAIQQGIAEELKLPVFRRGDFTPIRRGLPPELVTTLDQHWMVPLAFEMNSANNTDRHGYITIGAEHPFLTELALEICHYHGVYVLFCTVVMLDVHDLMDIRPKMV